jgi:hypothetical protein
MEVKAMSQFGKSVVLAAAVVIASAASIAEAYIPSSRTIAIRTAKNNGKGAYSIDQDVQFRAGSESVTLRERWIVQDGENMRVTVVGPANTNYRFDAIYKGGKRTSPDSSGQLKTSNVPVEFLEKYTHARTSDEILNSFVRAGIVPSSFLQPRQRFNPNAKTTHVPEPYVRLGRSNGVVNWVFGAPSPAESSKLLPSAWIEQDGFSLRRIRFSSEAEMSANLYSLQPGNAMFPRERTVTWNGNTAVIRMLSVKPLNAQQVASAMNPASLSANEAKTARLPDQTNVKEFYSRFR